VGPARGPVSGAAAVAAPSSFSATSRPAEQAVREWPRARGLLVSLHEGTGELVDCRPREGADQLPRADPARSPAGCPRSAHPDLVQ
jgi:hypothetical protein